MKKVEEAILLDIEINEAICEAFMIMGDPRGTDREARIIYRDGTHITIKRLSEDFATGIVEAFLKRSDP